MAKIPAFSNGTTSRMKRLVKEAQYAPEVKRSLCVLLGSLGMFSKDIASLLGYHASHVKRIWTGYRERGESAIFASGKKGMRNRANFSLEEEEMFLKPFLDQAQKGGVLIVSSVHQAYEKAFHCRVHHSVIYRLLHRHGWRKIVPRPSHPKSDKGIQETFKVSFPPGDRNSKKRGRSERDASSRHVPR